MGGASLDTVAVDFLTSPEYAAQHTDAPTFVSGLYRDLLQREPDGGDAGWIKLAATPGGRLQAAQGILNSDEYHKDLVDSYYFNLLALPADATGEAGWIQALKAGTLSADQVAELFLASDAYVARVKG